MLEFSSVLLYVLPSLLSLAVPAAGDEACPASRLHLSDPPYENYIFSDCHSASHVIISSPNPENNKAVPRLLVAWPAGNSGIAAFFSRENDTSGSLGIHLENSTSSGEVLDPIYEHEDAQSKNPRVGVSGLIHFDSAAVLNLPILGSIRSIRDYTEGGGNLNQDVQNAVVVAKKGDTGATVWRRWFDNSTISSLDFSPASSASPVRVIPGDKWMLGFSQGTYQFRAYFNYTQMEQLSPQAVLKPSAYDLIKTNPDQTTSLSFLSYKDKLLAGTWRFLTYFGRDSMISALLLQPVLSEGEGGAIEAAIGAVLERIDTTDGTVCHEEVIGDYATLLHRQQGSSSTAPSCDYKMVDTDYYLPVAMKSYFVDSSTGKDRATAFLNTKATFQTGQAGLTYAALAQLTAEKIMKTSAPFVNEQTASNLIHLKSGQQVGNWRDSNNGLGGGRTPYDINTALVPASLRAIAALSSAGFFPQHADWKDTAAQYAQVWEDSTLPFFHVSVSKPDAQKLVSDYVKKTSFAGPSNVENINGDITYYGLALGADNKPVPVMNTDDCFRHFLLNTTNQTQLSAYLDQTADHILQPFPVGLSTDAGLLVANPAYGTQTTYEAFKNSDYHGTVVWSWQLAMMAAGLARQLDRCHAGNKPGRLSSPSCPWHAFY